MLWYLFTVLSECVSGSRVPQGMKVCVSEVMYNCKPEQTLTHQHRYQSVSLWLWFICDQEANRCDLRVSLNWTRLVHTGWLVVDLHDFTPTRRLFSEVLSGPTVDLTQLKSDPLYCVPLKASWKSVRWNDASDVTKRTSLYIFVFHDLKSPHWDVWAWDEFLSKIENRFRKHCIWKIKCSGFRSYTGIYLRLIWDLSNENPLKLKLTGCTLTW